MISKDQWIQKAKALLFDFTMSSAEQSLKKEAQHLINLGGGYNYMTESSDTRLIWEEDKKIAEDIPERDNKEKNNDK